MARLTHWHRVAAEEFLAAVAQRGPVTLTGRPTPSPRVRVWWRLTWTAVGGELLTVEAQTLRTLYERAVAEEEEYAAMADGAGGDDAFPTPREMLGAIPDLTGGEPSDVYVRRLRDDGD